VAKQKAFTRAMQTFKPLTVHILGAGALGCLWAVHFHSMGHNVTLLTQHKSTDAFIRIDYVADFPDKNNRSKYDPSQWNIRCSTATKESIPIDHLVIATKSQDALAALRSVSHLLTSRVQVLTLCNGMGYHQAISDYLHEQGSNAQFWAGICSDGAFMSERTLRHTGTGVSYAGQLNSCRVDKAGPFFIEAGGDNNLLEIELYAPMELKIAQKFFINCAINPLTVLFQCRNGALLIDQPANQAFELLCTELQGIYAVYRNRLQETYSGLDTETDDFNVYQAASAVARNTASNQSSMLCDYLNGKTLELTYLNGYLPNMARQFGLDAIQNNKILRKLELLQSAKITT